MKPETIEGFKATVALLEGSVPPLLAIGFGIVLMYHCAVGTIGSQSTAFWSVTGAALTPYIGKITINGAKKVVGGAKKVINTVRRK